MRRLLCFLVAVGICLNMTGCKRSSSSGEKIYVICAQREQVPFLFEKEGKLTGINVRLLTKIMAQKEIKVQINLSDTTTGLLDVEKRRADGILLTVGADDKLKEMYDVSESYYPSGYMMAVGANLQVSSYEQLSGHTIGCVSDSQGATVLDKIKSQYGIQIYTAPTSSALYQDMTSGKCEGVFDEAAALKYALKKKQLTGQLIGELQEPFDYVLAVKKDENADLLTAFNEGLAELKKKGTYDKIIARYE